MDLPNINIDRKSPMCLQQCGCMGVFVDNVKMNY